MPPTFDLHSARIAILEAARRSCPAWLSGQAEDLAQTVLARLVERNAAGEGIDVQSPSYWQRAVHRALLDEIRRRRARREESLTVEQHATVGDLRSGNDPERAAAGRELGRAIRDCLMPLTDGRRRAVTLFLQGHGATETAALLGWDTKRAESSLCRGLADLRACLQGKGFGR